MRDQQNGILRVCYVLLTDTRLVGAFGWYMYTFHNSNWLFLQEFCLILSVARISQFWNRNWAQAVMNHKGKAKLLIIQCCLQSCSSCVAC